ncbi:DUF4258 domain-containing protein [Thermococcus aciditolerans]|uniref:DUF4258 domain-containing protein n=1 Tax=Thermococcus aciditolerans TaxID=2598455 RepID=A0A5C0SMB6_9EURY|nr:DUF4258 domain-containing protein [Thermococcus aciditolerans]QEK14937.1 DUF4258 domain-containing protein [Thermococcus aciditolerans]
MKIVLTEHAKERLKEREIDLKEVEAAINLPRRKFYDLRSGHFIAVGLRNIPGHWLIIAYDKREDTVEVITVIDTSKSLDKIIERRLSSRRWVEV